MTEKKRRWKNDFYKFIIANNFDKSKIDLLTALIFLNIATLHHEPYNQFLFVLGHEFLNKHLVDTKHV